MCGLDTLDGARRLLEESREAHENLLQISMLALAREFVKEWHERYPEDAERASQFLTAITILMEWKVLLLLPPAPRFEEEFEQTIAPLEPVDLSAFKQIALYLAERRSEQERMLRREPLPPGALQVEFIDPVLRLKLVDLQKAFQRVARRLLEETAEIRVRGEKVSRQECHDWLVRFLHSDALLRLEQVFEACPRDRAYWVVAFLLLLELVHQRRVGLSVSDGVDGEREVYISWLEDAGL